MDEEFNSASKEYPHRILFDGPRYPKNKKYLKKRDDDIINMFFRVFLVSGAPGPVKKYVVWVLIGCGIKFYIQRALLIEI